MPVQLILNSLSDVDTSNIARDLKSGKICVIPTDTIYGIVGSAIKEKTVEKIYQLRKRSKDKPMIILISEIKDLELFNITLSQHQKDLLYGIWPNPVSVILPCDDVKMTYLHRGKKSLAFRIPNHPFLKQLLPMSGPLVAPSANFEGYSPPTTIVDARGYFEDSVDLYIDGGNLPTLASTVVEFTDNGLQIIRQGAYQIVPQKL